MIPIKIRKKEASFKNYLSKNQVELLAVGAFLNEKIDLSAFSSSVARNIEKAIEIESFKGAKRDKILIYESGSLKRVLIYGLGDRKKCTPETLRSEGANIYKYVNSKKIKEISVYLKSFKTNSELSPQSILEGLFIGSYRFNTYITSKNADKRYTVNFDLITEGFELSSANKAISKAFILSESVSVARDLGNEPANLCTPTHLANTAIKIAKAKNMKAKVFDIKDFEKMKLGSFYGVARGAKEPAKFILVEYSGASKKEAPIGLIGKGLTFDTGGISLKPPAKMDEMKFDMCGSATVLGLMNAVSLLQPKVNIVFAIGATENMPGGDAQRPGDIVKAYNGKTIEVLNTDAEGRLVLADVLSYVNDIYKPSCMIDFATLTGAVIVALGHRATGIMTNSEKLVSSIQSSSKRTGEKVWELPLWEEYSEDIKSKYADIKNIGSGGAGTITAGAFLKEFVGNTPWCHLDIAGTAWGTKADGYNPKFGATGVAVRLIYDFIESKIK